MPKIPLLDPEAEEVVRRLRRIGGQVQGLQRMIPEGRDCADVAQQVAAARAALDRVAIDLIAAGLENSVRMDVDGKSQAKPDLDRLRRAFLMLRYPRLMAQPAAKFLRVVENFDQVLRMGLDRLRFA